MDDVQKLISAAAEATRKRFLDVPASVASSDLVPVGVWASTGSLALDRAIAGGVPGGVPMGPKRGRVIHVFGDPSLGKSVILDHLAKSVVSLGGLALIAETEGSRDPHFANAIGLDLNKVFIYWPETIEELFDYGLEWVSNIRKKNTTIPILWGWDSLELIESQFTVDKHMSDAKEAGSFNYGGRRSQAIGQGCRKVARACSRYPTSFVILNQVREDPTVMFGNPKKPGGGKAVPFFASVEVSLSASKYGKVTDTRNRVVSRWVKATVVKNKVARPFASCDFLISFDKGVSGWAGVMETLADEKIIDVKRDKSGKYSEAFFSVKDPRFVVKALGDKVPFESFGVWCNQSGVLKRDEMSQPSIDTPDDPEVMTQGLQDSRSTAPETADVTEIQ